MARENEDMIQNVDLTAKEEEVKSYNDKLTEIVDRNFPTLSAQHKAALIQRIGNRLEGATEDQAIAFLAEFDADAARGYDAAITEQVTGEKSPDEIAAAQAEQSVNRVMEKLDPEIRKQARAESDRNPAAESMKHVPDEKSMQLASQNVGEQQVDRGLGKV